MFRAARGPLLGRYFGLAAAALLLAFVLSRVGPTAPDLSLVLAPPSALHPLGTDHLGRDLLSRLSESIVGSVFPVWMAAMVASVLGIGAAALVIVAEGQRGMKIAASLFVGCAMILGSLPIGIGVFAAAAYYGRAGLGAVIVPMIVLILSRSFLVTLDLHRLHQKLGYWQAHEAMGGRIGARLIRYGMLGHWWTPLLWMAVFHLRLAVVTEASLSYLGFGVPEPAASLGNILSSHFDLILRGQIWVPAVAVAALLFVAHVPVMMAGLFCERSYQSDSLFWPKRPAPFMPLS